MPPSLRFTTALTRQHGYTLIAGVDEVGCGCLAGPVFAAAVILPPSLRLPRLDDSKRVPPPLRRILATRIQSHALACSVASVSVEEIDALGIRPATLLASRRAIELLTPAPDAVVSDAFLIPGLSIPCHPVIRADAKVRAVAAASIVAKVARDTFMEEQAFLHPVYGFADHKGYGTAAHLRALMEHGPCVLHRRSFKPVQEALDARVVPS